MSPNTVGRRESKMDLDWAVARVSAPLPPRKHNSSYGAHNFRRLKHVITEYDSDVSARLATLVERQSTATDPDLIRLIVDMLDLPSFQKVKMSRQLLSTPQSREVDRILEKKVSSDFLLSVPHLGPLWHN